MSDPRSVERRCDDGAGAWLMGLRRYLSFIAAANLAWEVLQLPLYTIWRSGTVGEIAFAVLHCTAGDLLIALSSLVLTLLVVGNAAWPTERFCVVMVLTILAGVIYTVFSEWLNLSVRQSWAYTELMPIVPIIGTGLAPLAQGIVIPSAAFWWTRRAVEPHNVSRLGLGGPARRGSPTPLNFVGVGHADSHRNVQQAAWSGEGRLP